MGNIENRKDDLHRRIGQELFPSETRAQKRQLQILRATIRLLSTEGPDSLAFERIAQECKVTRQLVMHYFSSRDELLEKVLLFICRSFQDQIVESFGEENARQQLETYVKQNLSWAMKSRDELAVWVYFYFRTVDSERFRILHRKMSDICRKRLHAIIAQGKKEKVFFVEDTVAVASTIHTLISGSFVRILTKDFERNEPFAGRLLAECLHLVGEANQQI